MAGVFGYVKDIFMLILWGINESAANWSYG